MRPKLSELLPGFTHTDWTKTTVHVLLEVTVSLSLSDFRKFTHKDAHTHIVEEEKTNNGGQTLWPRCWLESNFTSAGDERGIKRESRERRRAHMWVVSFINEPHDKTPSSPGFSALACTCMPVCKRVGSPSCKWMLLCMSQTSVRLTEMRLLLRTGTQPVHVVVPSCT